jgi:hypothetical protein
MNPSVAVKVEGREGANYLFDRNHEDSSSCSFILKIIIHKKVQVLARCTVSEQQVQVPARCTVSKQCVCCGEVRACS